MTGTAMRLAATGRALADRLGHRFRDEALLGQALTHGSRAGPEDNQRLEFLGDRVLGLVIADALLAADPAGAEGQIAPRFNALVRRETCAEVAREVGLGDALRLGRGEITSGGRRRETVLADAMEAVLAAVYLDAGLEAARAVILRLWATRIAAAPADARDAKTALQEWAQGRGMRPPAYELAGRDGPEHAPRFTIRVTLDTGAAETAEGPSKRAAEHLAAQRLLARVEGT